MTSTLKHGSKVLKRWSQGRLCLIVLLFGVTGPQAGSSAVSAEPRGVNHPLHGYFTEPLNDRFTRFRAALDAGQLKLDTGGELAFLRSVLKALEVPVSSQMLVTSATSLQKTIISPRRPRALYFNDDTYVGFVPGGRIEVISIDPERGAVFSIFDRLTNERVPRVRRSEECLTCHATPQMGEVPQLVIESVVPSFTGGGEKAFRRGLSGHAIPFDQRFGGWLVTGADDFPRHWGNMLLQRTSTGIRERPMEPGELFDLGRYPVPTSDLLPQLLHEHQVGFVNRATTATYRTRELLEEAAGREDQSRTELESLAHGLVRYLLFADEVPLPTGGIKGDPAFKTEFAAARRQASNGSSLRDLELRTRLLRYRCSYMIYSAAFAGLPPSLRKHVDRELERALALEKPAAEYSYLPAEEKRSIRSILLETVDRHEPIQPR